MQDNQPQMITLEEAQDHVNAVISQRDDAMNKNIQLLAALSKAQRENIQKDHTISILELKSDGAPKDTQERPTE